MVSEALKPFPQVESSLPILYGVKERRNHCRMDLRQALRHRLKSALGPADLLSVSYAMAHSELRHGIQLLWTDFLPRTQLIS